MKVIVKVLLGISLLFFISCDSEKQEKKLAYYDFKSDDINEYLNMRSKLSSFDEYNKIPKTDSMLKSIDTLIQNFDSHTYNIEIISPNDTLHLKNDKTSLKIYYNGKKDEVIFNGTKEEKEF